MKSNRRVVELFATSLDQEDYEVVASLLRDTCVYSCRGESYRGPAEIVASYRGHGDAAKTFDAITYESHVRESDGAFCIEFVDHIRHGENEHTFRCEQSVAVDDDGKIIRIDHRDLPGQREQLASFLDQLKMNGWQDNRD